MQSQQTKRLRTTGGQGELFEGLHNKVEPDVDTAATEAALDRLLANGVVRDVPREDGAGMKHFGPLGGRKLGGNGTMSGSTECASLDANTSGRSSVRILSPQELHTALDSIVDILSLNRRVPTFTLDGTDAFSSGA